MKLVFLSSFILIRKSNIIFTDNQNKVDITKERRRENLREKFPTRKKGRKLKNLIIEAAVSEMKATSTFSWVSFKQNFLQAVKGSEIFQCHWELETERGNFALNVEVGKASCISEQVRFLKHKLSMEMLAKWLDSNNLLVTISAHFLDKENKIAL